MRLLRADVDGVFCANDDIAMGALLWCREASTGRTELESPSPASTVWRWAGNDTEPRQRSTPRFEIGRRAAQMLLNKIKITSQP